MSKSRTKYFLSFKDVYTQEFTRKSSKGIKFAFCCVCRSDFNISRGGRYDISKHGKGLKHKNNVDAESSNKRINNFFSSKSDLDVIRAEVLFTSFLVEHNIAINAADHAGPLLRKMFTGNDIAKRYGWARTKTTSIINVMTSEKTANLVSILQSGAFSVACDGSNDTDYNLFSIVVSCFNPLKECVQSSLLSIPNLERDSTEENISKLMLSELEKLKIPIENCIVFGSDNANLMIGPKGGVFAFMKQHQNILISIGCCCHLINLSSEKGTAILPAKMEEILIDIYYLHKSSKRNIERIRNNRDKWRRNKETFRK